MPSSRKILQVHHESGLIELATIPMMTSNWTTIAKLTESDRPLPVQPVRISVGIPRYYGAWARQVPCVNELCPWGLLKIKTKRHFKRRYLERLEEHGVEAIHRRLAEVQDETERPLALLCYENLAKSWCHRRMFAEWWEEQTGQQVPEFKP